MIKVTIELHPFGSEADKKTLDEIYIWNDGTGTPFRGNYKFWWGKPGLFDRYADAVTKVKGELKDFPRKSYSSVELLRRVLEVAKTLGLR